MWKCSKCSEQVDDGFEVCWSCGTSKDGVEDPDFKTADEMGIPEGEAFALPRLSAEAVEELAAIPEGMLISTTHSLQTHAITRYLGVVSSQAVLGANVIADIFARVTDVVGGRSGTYESYFTRGRELAMAGMARDAEKRGANAVIGVSFDHETIHGSMVLVTCTGTAVVAHAHADPADVRSEETS